jgi:hypothetical protein
MMIDETWACSTSLKPNQINRQEYKSKWTFLVNLTLSSRLLEDSKQKILLVYILCSLGVEITEFHFGVLRTDTEPNTSMLPFGNSRP